MNWEKDKTLSPILRLAIDECLRTGLTTAPARKYGIPVRTLRRYKARERKRRKAMEEASSCRSRGFESASPTTASTCPRPAEVGPRAVDEVLPIATKSLLLKTRRRTTSIDALSIPAPTENAKKRRRKTTIDASSLLLTGSIGGGDHDHVHEGSVFNWIDVSDDVFEDLYENESDAHFLEALNEDDQRSLDCIDSSPFAMPHFSRTDSSGSESSVDDDGVLGRRQSAPASHSPPSSDEEDPEHRERHKARARRRRRPADSFMFVSITDLL